MVIDVISYDSPNVLETLIISKFRAQNYEDCDHPYTQRFVLPIDCINDLKQKPEGTNLVKIKSTTSCQAIRKGNQIIVSPEIITEIKGAELPTMNKKYFGKHYTYYYASGTYNPSHYSSSICKVNVNTKEMLMWKLESGFPGEAYFVANPNGTDEDDGIILAAVTNYEQGVDDFMVILDAKDLKEIGRVSFKNKIPTALHGIFIPTK